MNEFPLRMTSDFSALSILFRGLFASVQTIHLANQRHATVSHSAKPRFNWTHMFEPCPAPPPRAAPRRRTPPVPANVAPFDGQQPVGNEATWSRQSVIGWRGRERESEDVWKEPEGEKWEWVLFQMLRSSQGSCFSAERWGEREKVCERNHYCLIAYFLFC